MTMSKALRVIHIPWGDILTIQPLAPSVPLTNTNAHRKTSNDLTSWQKHSCFHTKHTDIRTGLADIQPYNDSLVFSMFNDTTDMLDRRFRSDSLLNGSAKTAPDKVEHNFGLIRVRATF